MEGFKETYFGKEISLSADQCYVLSVINRFHQKAVDIANNYREKYRSYKNFQTFATQGIRDGYILLHWHFESIGYVD